MEPFTRKLLKYSEAGRTVGASASLSLTIQSWKLLAATRLWALLVVGVPLLDVGESNLLQAMHSMLSAIYAVEPQTSDFNVMSVSVVCSNSKLAEAKSQAVSLSPVPTAAKI